MTELIKVLLHVNLNRNFLHLKNKQTTKKNSTILSY